MYKDAVEKITTFQTSQSELNSFNHTLGKRASKRNIGKENLFSIRVQTSFVTIFYLFNTVIRQLAF